MSKIKKVCVKTEVTIDGMCCDKCAKRAENALSAVHGVISADVKYRKGTALLRSREKLDEDEIKAAVESVGFTVVSFVYI